MRAAASDRSLEPMESFLAEHNVLFALVCGALAVLYGLYLA